MGCYSLSYERGVWTDVSVEPSLQPLSGEHLSLRTANREDNARVDVAASNFWSGLGQRAFFDIRVINPLDHAFKQITLNPSTLAIVWTNWKNIESMYDQ
jgi:hypothetical protein